MNEIFGRQLRDVLGSGVSVSGETMSPQYRAAILSEIGAMMVHEPSRFARHIDTIDGDFDIAFHDRIGTVRHIGRAVQTSELIVWSRTMWDASQRGAEIFAGRTMDWKWNDGRRQVWMWDNSIVFSDKEQLEDFKLDRQAALTAIVLGFDQGMYWIWAIFAPGFALDERLPATADEILDLCAKRIRYIGCIREGDVIGNSLSPLVASYAFMNSTVATLQTVRHSRQVRRNAARRTLELPREPRIVLLRKRARDSSVKGQVYEWSHQWIVSGHWRNQWYPKSKDHAPCFIQPYVKGPEGKPLLQPRDTIFSVNR